MNHFADRLTAAIRSKGNALCVGLDPRWESLPIALRTKYKDGTLRGAARAFEEFCIRVLDVVAPLVPVVKPQSAFFELCGPAGMDALQAVLRRAREKGLVTILDGKRNDIASTATAYADAAFGGVRIDDGVYPIWDADALTINAYLGRDSVSAFLESARRSARGLFVLVRTWQRLYRIGPERTWANPGLAMWAPWLVQRIRANCRKSERPYPRATFCCPDLALRVGPPPTPPLRFARMAWAPSPTVRAESHSAIRQKNASGKRELKLRLEKSSTSSPLPRRWAGSDHTSRREKYPRPIAATAQDTRADQPTSRPITSKLYSPCKISGKLLSTR